MPKLGLRTMSENWDVREAAYQVLLEGPLHRKVIFERIAERGVRLLGRQLLNTLSAQMGRDARLMSLGKGVWGIRKETP